MTHETPDATGPRLPDGTRLLHVGPHKTGTTSLQAALWAARPALLEQGVRHVGKFRNPASAVRAVTGQASPTSNDAHPPIRQWHELVRDIRRAREPRIVVSSEFFAWATPEVIERIARDLDGDRLHIAVTLRPLGRILPSQWQQTVQGGMQTRYETWLRQLFGSKPVTAREPFWWLHRHDELVERWAAVVGRERVTVIVVDERDHEMLLRAFGGLLGLRPGTLRSDRDLANRSMTLEEIEAIRTFNVAAKTGGVGRATHAAIMRYGAATHMKRQRPGPAERRIDTPAWALEEARRADEAIVAALAASGVRVIGDLESLAAPMAGRDGEAAWTEPVLAPARVAGEMAMGVALASGLVRRLAGRSLDGTADLPELDRIGSRTLGAIILRRGRGMLGDRIVRVRRAAGWAPRGAGTPPKGPAVGPGPTAVPGQAALAGSSGKAPPAALPAGTRILHIGPPKTGTTSVQAAFWAARESALAQGLRYPGQSRHPAQAVRAATGRRPTGEGGPVPPIGPWADLLAEIRAASEARVLLSSGELACASDSDARKVVDALDPARTHVVVTLRPITRLLVSEWQEHAQSGLGLTLDAWLHTLFDEPSHSVSTSFWHRQRHDALISRWAAVAGPENVTAVVVDDRDHEALLRTFEALCGLRSGTLAPDSSVANRSLTLAEITAIRALAERWTAEGLGEPGIHRVIRNEVAAEMRKRVPDPDEPRIATPQWALNRATAVADEIVAGISASGVRVIGDLEWLREAPGGHDPAAPVEIGIPPVVSAAMAMGVLKASGAMERWGGAPVEPIETARASTRRLSRLMIGRVAGSVTGRHRTSG